MTLEAQHSRGGVVVRLIGPGEACVVCTATDEEFERAWFGTEPVRVCDDHYHFIESRPGTLHLDEQTGDAS